MSDDWISDWSNWSHWGNEFGMASLAATTGRIGMVLKCNNFGFE